MGIGHWALGIGLLTTITTDLLLLTYYSLLITPYSLLLTYYSLPYFCQLYYRHSTIFITKKKSIEIIWLRGKDKDDKSLILTIVCR